MPYTRRIGAQFGYSMAIVRSVLGPSLLKVIHLVVGSDQTCGVPGQFIWENVAFLCDVVDYCTASGQPGLILSLDQEKAFDWSFLHSVLLPMAFGPSFRNWVRLLYHGASSAVNVNWIISDSFPLTRGVRQGCPLLPLLYVLVGLVTPLPFISADADHTSLVLCLDHGIMGCFKVYNLYKCGSGARLNLS